MSVYHIVCVYIYNVYDNNKRDHSYNKGGGHVLPLRLCRSSCAARRSSHASRSTRRRSYRSASTDSRSRSVNRASLCHS